MFCPRCSTRKTAVSTQFCSKCGLDLFGLDEFVDSDNSGHMNPNSSRSRNIVSKSQIQKGAEQGLLLIVFGLLLIPVWMYIPGLFPPDDRLVESAPSTTAAEMFLWILMWIAFIAGAGRIAAGLVLNAFHKREMEDRLESIREISLLDAGPATRPSLPAADLFRPADPGVWRATEDLVNSRFNKPRTTGDL